MSAGNQAMTPTDDGSAIDLSLINSRTGATSMARPGSRLRLARREPVVTVQRVDLAPDGERFVLTVLDPVSAFAPCRMLTPRGGEVDAVDPTGIDRSQARR